VQHSFDLAVLLLPAVMIFSVTVFASWRVTRSAALALVLATIKAGLYLGYYGWAFDGRFTFLDDWTYLERGASLRDDGVAAANLIDNLPLLFAAGEGDHFLYYLWNLLAIGWFGEGYYAPVALNVVVAVAVAWLAVRLVVAQQLIAPALATPFFVFVLLHPDITAWSTVLNGKDTLVLLSHVLLLTAVSWYLRGLRTRALLLAVTVGAALMFLRYYVPLLFGLALALTVLVGGRGAVRWPVAAFGAAALGAVLAFIGEDGLLFAFDLLRSDLVNPLYGLVRFLLTPVPFGTDENYAFLDLPALLHWILLPAAFVGIWAVARRHTAFARFLIAYTAVFVALYAIYGELQGPRHRLQLDFAWATYQFVGIVAILSAVRALARRRAARLQIAAT
jgi:hypothetical protein